MIFADDNVSIICGSAPKPPATRQELVARYPGVQFGSPLRNVYIAPAVHIEPGATISTTCSISITGQSWIGPQVVIEGGEINYSKCTGNTKITGGTLNHCREVQNADITGGSLNHCTVENGTVTGGSLNHTRLSDGARVTGGALNHCIVSNGATVSNGTRNHETIDGIHASSNNARAPASITIGGNAVVHFGNITTSNSSHPAPSIVSSTAITSPSSVRHSLPSPMNIDFNEEYDTDPPDHLLDNAISFGLIHEAVMTPNGDTYDRRDIERCINSSGICPITRQKLELDDLRLNRALQQQIDAWKAQHRIVAPVEMSVY